MARALATDPQLLLLDEPTAGMNPRETLELRDHIVRMRDELGLTVIVIEHDMRVVKGVSDRVIACDYGQKIAEGTYDEVAHDERVIEAYLGTKTSDRLRTAACHRSCELRNVSTHYGLVAVLRDVDMEIYRRGDGLPPRRQREREDDHPQDDPGLCVAVRGGSGARRRGRLGPHHDRGREARCLDGPGEPPPVPGHDRGGEPPTGCVPRKDRKAVEQDPGDRASRPSRGSASGSSRRRAPSRAGSSRWSRWVVP